jgi:hypothetical protein
MRDDISKTFISRQQGGCHKSETRVLHTSIGERGGLLIRKLRVWVTNTGRANFTVKKGEKKIIISVTKIAKIWNTV